LVSQTEGLAIHEEPVRAALVLDRKIVTPTKQFLLHHVTHANPLALRVPGVSYKTHRAL
jgi:hypothetical protein